MSNGQQRREFLVKGLTLGTTLVVAELAVPRCVRAMFAGEASPATPSAQAERGLAELAYCGFDCEKECALFEATRNNDMRVKEEFASRWNKRFGVSIKPEDAACDGCRSKSGRLGYHCGTVCDVRKCGLSRGIESCAVCPDFLSCKKELWTNWPQMRQRTEEKRKRLGRS